MTAKSRYWDHERCAWVDYEAAAAPSTVGGTTERPAEPLPEQRADEPAAAPAQAAASMAWRPSD